MKITSEMRTALIASAKDMFNPSAETWAKMKECHEQVMADPETQRLLQQMADANEPHPFCRTEI